MHNLMEFPQGDRIYIVLSRSETVLSRMVNKLTGAEVTHAAISLDSELEYMFSFGRRWASNPFIGCFHRERIDEGIYKKADQLPGVVIELRVTPAQYRAVSKMISDFLLNYHRYEFNYLGLIKQALGRHHTEDNRFFCSEFVYHVLHSCGICDFKRPRSSVHPQELLSLGRIVYRGDLLRRSEAGPKVTPFPMRTQTRIYSGDINAGRPFISAAVKDRTFTIDENIAIPVMDWANEHPGKRVSAPSYRQ